MTKLTKSLKPPYYAVIFTSTLAQDDPSYHAMAKHMEDLVNEQEGYLGLDAARSEIGITISYWESLEAIQKWKNHHEHQAAQKLGKSRWYDQYQVQIAKVERVY